MGRDRQGGGGDGLAVDLTVAVGRLRSRLRGESGLDRTGLSITQLALLKRVILEGPTTAAALAAAEHISQQAIAQNLTGLRAGGLIATRPDPTDGRKTLIAATPAGRRLRATLFASREAWLTEAIASALTAEERVMLERAVALIERLADAQL